MKEYSPGARNSQSCRLSCGVDWQCRHHTFHITRFRKGMGGDNQLS